VPDNYIAVAIAVYTTTHFINRFTVTLIPSLVSRSSSLTSPGMPMYIDAPGFQVVTEGKSIRVVVPDYRVRFKTDLKYDAVGAYMQLYTAKVGHIWRQCSVYTRCIACYLKTCRYPIR
jgi:hypothetical protein